MELQDFNSNYHDLLIATIVLLVLVILLDIVGIVMQVVHRCRKNPEGKIFQFEIIMH